MSNKDYSAIEIKNIVNDLLDNHYGKLMRWEINVLEDIKLENTEITQVKRDWLIGVYDRIGEVNYE